MIVKPFAFFGGAGVADIFIVEDTLDFNLTTFLGSVSARQYSVTIVDAVIGSSDPSTPAFDTGAMTPGASVLITRVGTGRIQGAGGAGGGGGKGSTSVVSGPGQGTLYWHYGGGGGGGQGYNPGVGGLGADNIGTAGSSGTKNAAGAAGANVNFQPRAIGGYDPTAGGVGGVGLSLQVNATIQDLQVYGGGGGGGGGAKSTSAEIEPGAGGAAGAAGANGYVFGGVFATGGAAGVAIARNGNTLTQLGSNIILGAVT